LQESVLRSKFNQSKLENFVTKFEKYFRKYEKGIMKSIEKYSGFTWKRKLIKVWIVESYNVSVPDPLLLNCYNYKKDFTLFELIHMLTLNLFLDNDVHQLFTKNINHEAVAYLITKKVSENFFTKRKMNKLCEKAEFDGFRKYIWEKVQEFEKIWDLNNKPLKKWIKESS